MMMSKGMIAFIIVAILGLFSLMIIYMIKPAVEAQKRSDDIMEQFKTVDKGLKKSNQSLDSARKMLLDSLKKTYR
jgi:hypothetical protein